MKTFTKNIGRIYLWISAVSVFLCPCLFSGCAANFQTAKTPDSMALIYVYRPKKFFGGSAYAVKANGFKINALYNGGYFVYIARPGRIQLSARSETTNYITFDVQADQTYYVRGTVRPGNTIQRPYLQLVSTETGKNEIMSCKQIEQDKNSSIASHQKSDQRK